jgi:hypothetical protein
VEYNIATFIDVVRSSHTSLFEHMDDRMMFAEQLDAFLDEQVKTVQHATVT